MARILIQLPAVCHFRHHSQIHDAHPVRNMADHGQVMGDKKIGQTQLFLQLAKQVDDLGLDGHVQGRDRLVTDDKLRLHSQSPGNSDPLTLAAGKFMGIPGTVLRS